MKTMAQMFEQRKYALLFFFLTLFGAFLSLSTITSGESLFGKDGWVLFHTDKEGTRYYYDENSVVAIGDARSARYIIVYITPKSDNYIYGYVVDAQAKCGLLFYKFRIMNMQAFGKAGPMIYSFTLRLLMMNSAGQVQGALFTTSHRKCVN